MYIIYKGKQEEPVNRLLKYIREFGRVPHQAIAACKKTVASVDVKMFWIEDSIHKNLTT